MAHCCNHTDVFYLFVEFLRMEGSLDLGLVRVAVAAAGGGWVEEDEAFSPLDGIADAELDEKSSACMKPTRL